MEVGTLVLDEWAVNLGNKTGFGVCGQCPLLYNMLHLYCHQIHYKPTVPTAHYVPYAKKPERLLKTITDRTVTAAELYSQCHGTLAAELPSRVVQMNCKLTPAKQK